MTVLKRLVVLAVAALLGAAVVEQLRRPRVERTWRGRVAGVPYDLRLPTPQRFAETMWRPDDKRLIVERPPFGLGWGVNLARLMPEQRGRHSSVTEGF